MSLESYPANWGDPGRISYTGRRDRQPVPLGRPVCRDL